MRIDLIIAPRVKSKQTGGLKYTWYISKLFTDKNQVPWETVQ